MTKMTKLGEATAQATIHAPVERIDISEWLFGLSSEDYEACAEGHQSAAQGRLPSGRRVSMNVEHVAGFFMVQHYIETISERDRVLTVSPNTVLWLNDEKYVMLQITWELAVSRIDQNSSLLTCKVNSETENEDFVKATHELTKDLNPEETPFQLHIKEETPLFAKNIEAKALQGIWN